MLFLDYRLPRISRYLLFLDAPFRYSWRHLIQYFTSRIVYKKTQKELLTARERFIHFTIAFLEILPIIGILVALIDVALFSKRSDKAYTSFMFHNVLPIYSKIFGPDPKQESYILPRYIDEMKKIAHDSSVPYADVLRANTILDRLSLFGGSIIAQKGQACKIATNYFHSHGRGSDVADISKSFWRFDTLQQASIHDLARVNMHETIASCLYDGKNIRYSFGADYSANRPYKTQKLPWKPTDIRLAHNIDIPMNLLAPFTRITLHKNFCSVGWLGIVGTYFGVNEHGLALAACSVPHFSQDGTPNHLLFRQILEEARDGNEALKLVEKALPAVSMNLIVAAADGLYRVEIGLHKNSAFLKSP